MISPSAVISKLRSGCSAQNAVNPSSVIGAAVKVAGRFASLIKNDMTVVYRSKLPILPLRPLRSERDYGAAVAVLDGLAVRPERSLLTLANLNPMWLTLLGLVIGEKLMGIPGMILAPVILHYIKVEASKNTYSTNPKTENSKSSAP